MKADFLLAIFLSVLLLSAAVPPKVSFAQGDHDTALAAKIDALISKVKTLKAEQDVLLKSQKEIQQEIAKMKVWVNKKR